MSLWLALLIIAFGVAVLLQGNRLWLLGAGAGALLGVILVSWFPSLQTVWLSLLTVVGLALAGGLLVRIGKGLANLVATLLGFFAGGALVLYVLDAFSIDVGGWEFVIAGAVGLLGAFLANKFFDWTIAIVAGLVGAFLVVRGIEFWVGDLNKTVELVLILGLAAFGLFFQMRKRK
jgi:hypothetical protein